MNKIIPLERDGIVKIPEEILKEMNMKTGDKFFLQVSWNQREPDDNEELSIEMFKENTEREVPESWIRVIVDIPPIWMDKIKENANIYFNGDINSEVRTILRKELTSL